MSKSMRLWFVVCVSAIALVAAGCGAASDSENGGAQRLAGTSTHGTVAQGTSREFFDFDSLGEMVATSSAVVEGTVVDLAPGRVVGEGHDQEQYTSVVVRVTQQLSGDAVPATLRIEELTSYAGSPIVLDGVQPSKAGDTGIYFLRRVGDGSYVLISSQGRYLQRGSALAGSNPDDALVKRLQQMDVATLKQRVDDAERDIADGKVKPKPGPPGLSR